MTQRALSNQHRDTMRTLLALSLAVLVLVAGCSRGKYSSNLKHPDHVLVYPMPNNPTKLDPATVEDGDTLEVLTQVFEGLVEYNEQNELVGNLAESWDVSDDGLTYTFHLKKGVKFHSGREMTAEDVKFSWDRAATPSILSPTAEGYMADIVGFDECWHGQAQGLSGVKVVDPYTIQVQIKEPKAYWPMYLQYACYFVVDKDVVGMEPIESAERMVGTGPFTVKEVRADQQVVLERFNDYHKGAPKLERIIRLIVQDPNTRRSLYENGEVDWVQLERQDKQYVDQHPEFKNQLHIIDRPAIWYLGFSVKMLEPFKDARVRKAFAMAIDKDRIINEGFDGINQRADGIIPPGIPGHDPNFKGIPYDPAQAKRLLAEAGYPDPSKFPTVPLYYRADRADPRIVAQHVQQDLQKNLGINVELRPMEWKALLEKRNKGELEFFHLRWHADYLDPQNFLSFMLHTNARENTLGYSNPEFDRLCDMADRMPLSRNEERFKLYREAERIAVVEDAIWIPIYFQRDLELLRPEVTGIRRSLMGPLPHTQTDVVRSK
ncbi:MAG: peptide ABC transporter substrate-binding protein [Fimbriimonadales bacterium]|nr:MAG: peptide ABC transporter substrate-binding protein [Fimbriimonadales bacterium]